MQTHRDGRRTMRLTLAGSLAALLRGLRGGLLRAFRDEDGRDARVPRGACERRSSTA